LTPSSARNGFSVTVFTATILAPCRVPGLISKLALTDSSRSIASSEVSRSRDYGFNRTNQYADLDLTIADVLFQQVRPRGYVALLYYVI
jgi:hypothetical protein